jgi:sulfoxide reductase heme-binding subunit YedZ
MLKFALGFALILPLAWIGNRFFFAGPSANPAQELNHLFGRVAIYVLAFNLYLGHILSLQRWILSKFPSWARILLALKKYRRHLGVAGWVYLFVHIGFHFLIEAGLAQGLDAILHAHYLWVGSCAALLITLLAVTSNDTSQRWLKKRWSQLHRLVYVAFVFAVAHTLMIEKADIPHFTLLAIATALPYLLRLGNWAMKQRSQRDARQQLPPY